MQFTVNQADLRDAVSRVARATQTKAALSALEDIRLTAGDGTLQLSGTDLIVATTVTIPATVAEPGAALVPAARLTEMVPNLPPGDVTLATVDGGPHVRLTAASGRQQVTSRLNGDDVEMYPVVPTVTGDEPAVTVPVIVLREALEQVQGAMAGSKDGRPVLAGVGCEVRDDHRGARMILSSTDGYRLATTEVPLANAEASPKVAPFHVIVDGRGARELLRLLTDDGGEVVISLGRPPGQSGNAAAGHDSATAAPAFAYLVAELGATTFVTRLLDGTFPDVDQIVPKGPAVTTITVDRLAFRMVLAINLPFSRDDNDVVVLRATGGHNQDPDPETGEIVAADRGLRVAAESANRGDVSFEMAAEVTGPAVEVQLNGVFVRDVLMAGRDGDLVIEITDADRAVVVRPTCCPAIHVLMPMVRSPRLAVGATRQASEAAA